ncbi:MAG: hypothetical protein ACFFA5_03955, partial [Promethearchaeota archaeon]
SDCIKKSGTIIVEVFNAYLFRYCKTREEFFVLVSQDPSTRGMKCANLKNCVIRDRNQIPQILSK